MSHGRLNFRPVVTQPLFRVLLILSRFWRWP